MSSTTEQAASICFVSGVTLGEMTEHDLLEVVEIEERSGLSRWGWSAYYAELQSDHSLMFVARLRRPLEQVESFNLAGYLVARVSAGELHINNVAVREQFRGKGIGSALLSKALQEGAATGAERGFLEVRCGNSAAQALYRKCGFELVGQRSGYYSDPPEDALIMSVELQGDA
jgi:[ribosomal protein S18]-alanine N-acetyltransferase